MEATEILVGGGVAALLAAAAGGGLKAFGVEVPALASVRRQALLAVAGVGLVIVGLAPWRGGEGDTGLAESAIASAPAQEETGAAQVRARPEVPNIYDLPFPTARQFLMQNGWAPIRMVSPMGNDELGLRKQEIFDTGFFEAVSCSGSGTAPCLFRYRNPAGFVLEVKTVGEDLNYAVVNEATILDCTQEPKPYVC